MDDSTSVLPKRLPVSVATRSKRDADEQPIGGADLPIDDWLVAAGAGAAVIGVPTSADREVALAVASALRAADPGLPSCLWWTRGTP